MHIRTSSQYYLTNSIDGYSKRALLLSFFLLWIGSSFGQTWTGNVDTDWHTPGNWDTNVVPSATSDVTIPLTTNAPIISGAAVARSMVLEDDMTLAINAGATFTLSSVQGSAFINRGFVTNSGSISINGTAGVNGLSNENTSGALTEFHNNGSLSINGPFSNAISNTQVFVNTGTITIGGISAGGVGINNSSSMDHNSGSIIINRTTAEAIRNTGTFGTRADVLIGNQAGVGNYGIHNFNRFNHVSGNIQIDRSSVSAILNTGFSSPVGVFNNRSNLIIGASASVGSTGLRNETTFINFATGDITIDRCSNAGIDNQFNPAFNHPNIFTNDGLINIGANQPVGLFGIDNDNEFNNTNGTINIDRSTSSGIHHTNGTFTNQAVINIGGIASVGSDGILCTGIFDNNGGEVNIDHATVHGIRIDGVVLFNNHATVNIGANTPIPNMLNVFNFGQFNNHPTGVLGGVGTILNNAYRDFGGTISPGVGTSAGVINFPQSAIFPTSTFAVDINGASVAGVDFDQLSVGTATILDRIELSVNYTPTDGDNMIIVDGSNIITTFPTISGLLPGWTVEYNMPNTGDISLSYENQEWTGTVNTDWHNPGNWANNAVPSSSSNVRIPNRSNDPVISSSALAESVTIENNAVLSISSSGLLTVNGASEEAILNQGTLENHGLITLGNSSSIGDYGINNEGTINHQAGQISIDQASQISIFNNGGTFNSFAPVIIGTNVPANIMIGGSTGSFTNHVGGEVRGAGIIETNALTTNGGAISPEGVNRIITFNSSFDFSNSILKIDVDGLSDFDQIVIQGSGVLGGSLEVSVNYTASIGNSFLIIDASSPLNFNFSSISGLPLGWETQANIPNLGNFTLSFSQIHWTGTVNSDWETSGNWNINAVPSSSANVFISDVVNDPILTGNASIRSLTLLPNVLLVINGSLSLNQSAVYALLNEGTIENNGNLNLGDLANVDLLGIDNRGTFNNQGTITINRNTVHALFNRTGVFTNIGTINIGNLNNLSNQGIFNQSTFINSNTGTILINNCLNEAINNRQGTFTNQGLITLGNSNDIGISGISNRASFQNNGGQINIDRFTNFGLHNFGTGSFTNQADISIGTQLAAGGSGIENASTFNHNAGVITIQNTSLVGIRNVGGSFENGGTVNIASIVNNNLIDENSGGQFNNNMNGIVNGSGTISATSFVNNGGTLSPALPSGILTFDGDEDFSNAKMMIEVNDFNTPGVDFEQIIVNGMATLGGELEVQVNTVLNINDAANIIDAVNLSGTFSSIVFLPSAGWITEYDTPSPGDVTITYLGVAWTGAVNANWEVAGNWLNNILPTLVDEVIVTNQGFSPIINSSETIARLNVNAGATLTINNTASLLIEGQTNIIDPSILNEGTIHNNGNISIGLNMTAGFNGMDNRGVFNNAGTLSVNNTFASGILNSTGIFNNDAAINIAISSGSGIINQSTFNHNAGQIAIDNTGSSGIQNSFGTFNNHADIIIGAAPSSNMQRGLSNVAVFNHFAGLIQIDRTSFAAIVNQSSNSFTNQSDIIMGSMANVTRGIQITSGTFSHEAGLIKIDRAALGITTRDTFYNQSIIEMGEVAPLTDLIRIANGNPVFFNQTGGVLKGRGGEIDHLSYVGAGGTLAPGNSPGLMEFTGNENFSNSILEIEIDGVGTAGIDFDEIAINGTATLGGTLLLSINYIPSIGDQITFIDAVALSDTFLNVGGLLNGWELQYDVPNAGEVTLLFSGAPLPVELINFTAKEEKGQVLLNWSTASEYNNLGFTVQRSIDGLRWQDIGFVQGQGTVTYESHYAFIDDTPNAGLNYYRLQQMDDNGTVEYSEVRTVNISQAAYQYTIYPNPTSSYIMIEGAEVPNESLDILIVNAMGTSVFQVQLVGEKQALRLDHLSPGVYTLIVRNSGAAVLVSERIVVLGD